jgi:hypothetical protein
MAVSFFAKKMIFSDHLPLVCCINPIHVLTSSQIMENLHFNLDQNLKHIRDPSPDVEVMYVLV